MISDSLKPWLENEQRKFESFTEENFRDFSKACQQEVDWLKNYLRDIIVRSKKLETINSDTRDNIGSATISKERLKVQHRTMNVPNSNIPQNSQKVVPKRLVKTKPEIKSLVRAAAIKKEQEEHEKKTAAKEWETKRLAASQRRQEEQQKRLQIAKQREEEWKRKANLITDTKKKEEKKRIDQSLQKPFDIKKKKDVDLNQNKPAPHEKNLTSSVTIEDSQSEDSEDDDSFVEVAKYKDIRPSWCQPHNIRAALIRQASIDPETIFGSIQPLDMS
ncbi:25244_t:CDS:2, partial [Racocetra persica]